MSLLPAWAPNIHPVLIHFPIVLLLLAPLLDLGAILFKKQRWLLKNANLAYLLAGLSVLVAYISGHIAADSVDIPTGAYLTLATHADWAFYTLVLGGLNAVIRGWQLFRKNDERLPWYLIIPGVVVVILLLFTADNGAKLVYAHGVGVTIAQPLEEHHNSLGQQADHHGEQADAHSPEGSAEPGHSGGSTKPSGKTSMSFTGFEWLLGDAKLTSLERKSEQVGSEISLALNGQEVLLVLPDIFTDLEFTARLNRDEFHGTVRLVHHVMNAQNYDFLEVDNRRVTQGRVSEGKLKDFDNSESPASGWISLKVVSSTGHFRGYVDQNMVTHGHGPELSPGKLGIYAQGTGTLRFADLQGVELE
jgi:uncharacterized membrane protein